MKKFFAAILSLALFACCALAESADITGMWYFDMYGLVATMEIREDSTFTMDFVGDVMDGTYAFDGTNLTLTYDGEEEGHSGVYDPAAQTLSIEDGTFVFSREEVAVYVPANVREDSALEDFTGSWETFKVGTQGLYIDPDGAGIALNLSIEGDAVTIAVLYGGEGVEVPVTGVFADGVLTAGIVTADDTGAANSITFEMRLLEDGNLAASYMEAENLTFYLAPVTEEAPAE